jgi:hypothetical protein
MVHLPVGVFEDLRAATTAAGFGSESEYAAAALESYLVQRNFEELTEDDIQQWLVNEVGPTYDEFAAGITKGTPIEEVRAYFATPLEQRVETVESSTANDETVR